MVSKQSYIIVSESKQISDKWRYECEDEEGKMKKEDDDG